MTISNKALRVPRKKWHGTCIYKIREVTSPLHKTFRGFRFIVAVPNMQGHKPFTNEPAASFSRQFLLFQSSDWNFEELEQKVKGAILFLINRGFEKVEPAQDYEARMEVERLKTKTTVHKEREEQ